jgi:hypothetical protein
LFLDTANGVGFIGMKGLGPFLDSKGFNAVLLNTEIEVAEKLNHEVFFLFLENSVGQTMSKLDRRLQLGLN